MGKSFFTHKKGDIIDMKKILVCMFLLVFSLCLVGCETPEGLIKPIDHNHNYID